MMENKILKTGEFVIVVLTFMVVVLILFFLLSNRTEQDTSNESHLLMERMYMEDNVRESILNNDLSVQLQTVNSDVPILICSFSSQSCGGCVDFATNKIKESFPDFGKNNQILFLASGFNKKKHFDEKKIMNLGAEKLGLEIDNSLYVCYFILFKGKVSHLFIPEKSFSNYTDIYLDEIKKRYFNK